MGKKNKFPLFILISLLAILVIILFMHASDNLTILYPKGWVGIQQRNLIAITSLVMLFIVIPVIVLTVYFGWKYREGNDSAKHEPDWDQSHLLEAIWWGIPCVVIIFFAILTWKSSHELDPYKPLSSTEKPLKIQAIALEWKWLFIYPDYNIATVNFIQFPKDQPLLFEITADAPMNSFWIPDLGGQIYAMPGMRTELNLIANHEGDFRGLSANLSGSGFAGMTFTAKASTEQEFQQWIRSIAQSANTSLDKTVYDQLVLPSSYNPVAYYTVRTSGLFDQIIMKYMTPMDNK